MNEVKLSDILNARMAISPLIKREGLDNVLSYKLMKFMKETDDDEKFFDEKRQSIAELHGQKEDGKFKSDDKGMLLFIDDNHKIAAESELKELAKTVVTTPRIMFNLSEFSDLGLSPMAMMALDPFIIDPFATIDADGPNTSNNE